MGPASCLSANRRGHPFGKGGLPDTRIGLSRSQEYRIIQFGGPGFGLRLNVPKDQSYADYHETGCRAADSKVASQGAAF